MEEGLILLHLLSKDKVLSRLEFPCVFVVVCCARAAAASSGIGQPWEGRRG